MPRGEESTHDGRVVESLEKCELGGIGRSGRIERSNSLHHDVAVRVRIRKEKSQRRGREKREETREEKVAINSPVPYQDTCELRRKNEERRIRSRR